jgi:hypothetical protein
MRSFHEIGPGIHDDEVAVFLVGAVAAVVDLVATLRQVDAGAVEAAELGVAALKKVQRPVLDSRTYM